MWLTVCCWFPIAYPAAGLPSQVPWWGGLHGHHDGHVTIKEGRCGVTCLASPQLTFAYAYDAYDTPPWRCDASSSADTNRKDVNPTWNRIEWPPLTGHGVGLITVTAKTDAKKQSITVIDFGKLAKVDGYIELEWMGPIKASDTSGKSFRAGILLDFVRRSSATRTMYPHGACVRRARRNGHGRGRARGANEIELAAAHRLFCRSFPGCLVPVADAGGRLPRRRLQRQPRVVQGAPHAPFNSTPMAVNSTSPTHLRVRPARVHPMRG